MKHICCIPSNCELVLTINRGAASMFSEKLDDMKKIPVNDSHYVSHDIDFIFSNCIRNCDFLSEILIEHRYDMLYFETLELVRNKDIVV
jgi:hypothetical protein